MKIEEGKTLAQIRNLMSPIVNYFQMKKLLNTNYDVSSRAKLIQLIKIEETNCKNNIDKIKKLLDSLG